jgi:hypothetical protein
MYLTQAKKFVYTLLAIIFITIFILVLTNIYRLDVFLVSLSIEFLVVTEMTKPFTFNAIWRKNIAFFVIIVCIILAILVIQRSGQYVT